MRTDRVAFYDRRSTAGSLIGFEVILPRHAKAETIRGRDYPARECYPSDEAFGARAWYYMRQQEADALAKYAALVDRFASACGGAPETAIPA